jgi:DNA-binding winged helix-turn-helix (wHTH) protein
MAVGILDGDNCVNAGLPMRVAIQGHPFQVLRLLLEAEGKVVTREELRQVLWSEDTKASVNS